MTKAYEDFEKRRLRTGEPYRALPTTGLKRPDPPLSRESDSPTYLANREDFRALGLDPAFSGRPSATRAGHMTSVTYSDEISMVVPNVPIHLVRRVATQMAAAAGRIKFELGE